MSSPGYLTITSIEGDPDELADIYREFSETMSEVGRDQGLILHAATKAEDGLRIINLWPSRDHSEAAARDPRRLRTLAQSGISSDRFHRSHYETLDYVVFD
jgi:hypothetical protein